MGRRGSRSQMGRSWPLAHGVIMLGTQVQAQRRRGAEARQHTLGR